MTPSRILITGINGLIGGVLHTALAEKYDVYGMDELGPFSGRVVSADISDYQQVARVFETLHPQHVIHLAGNPSPEASWEEVLGANIVGTRNIFEAARVCRVARVVYASSNHVTGGYEGIEFELLPTPADRAGQDLHKRSRPPR